MWPTASVTACVSLVVFQHIPDPAITLGYIREIGRVLRPGGWAAFQVSNDPWIHRRRFDRDQWRVRIGALDRARAPPPAAPRLARQRRRSLDDVRSAAADAGMDTERVAGEGRQLCYVRTRKR